MVRVVEDRRIMRLSEEEDRIMADEVKEIVDKETVLPESFAVTKGIMTYSSQIIVGYALTSKKTKSFLKPKLEGIARLKGISFVAIDLNKSLSEQGPFSILLQKLSGKEWLQILEDYRLMHPQVIMLDPPYAIQRLRNRQLMLQDVASLNLSNSYGSVGIPRQLVINNDASSIPNAVAKAGLSFPLVAKPLCAKSHALSLAYDHYSLKILEPPIVLQEFVNHGGLLFKVNIIGETIKVVRRFSLPNVCKHEVSKKAGVFHFPRVSSAAASADDAHLDPDVAELPPMPLLEKLGRELRKRLGLRLFNLDMIREYGSRNKFYVIDINYFPGSGDVLADVPVDMFERQAVIVAGVMGSVVP